MDAHLRRASWLLVLFAAFGCAEPNANYGAGAPPDPWADFNKRLVAKTPTRAFAYDMTYSPDGKFILVTSVGGLEVRHPDSLELLKLEPKGAGHHVESDRTNNKVITGSSGGAVRVWSGPDLKLGYEFHPHGSDPNFASILHDLKVSHDGRYVITCSPRDGRTGTIIWDLTEKREIVRVDGEDLSPAKFAIYPSTAIVASVSEKSRTVRLLTIPGLDGAGDSQQPEQQFVLSVIAFSSSGALLGAGDTRHLYVWRRNDDGWTLITSISYKTSPGGGQIAFSPHERFVAYSGLGGVRVHDIATGNELVSIPRHGPASWERAVSFSPDGKRIAYITSGGACFVLDVSDLYDRR